MSGTQPSADTSNQVNLEATTMINLEKDQEESIVHFALNAQSALTNRFNLRAGMEQLDKEYAREVDFTPDQVKSQMLNRAGDSSRFQNITVPIVMPQVQAAHSYLSNVFLTGYPIFGVTSDPTNETAALQMETIIGENSTTAGWARELSMFFRDSLKYNIAAVEVDWQERNVWTIETDATAKKGRKAVKKLWQGNVLKRMDLYNTFWDPRVHPTEIHKYAEFVGYNEIYSKVRFKDFVNSLTNVVAPLTIMRALKSPSLQGSLGSNSNSAFGYYLPVINPLPTMDRSSGLDWMQWAMNGSQSPLNPGINYSNIYCVTILYARIIPSDYGLKVPNKNTPQVWRFRIVNGHVVLTAERMSNIHNFIPILFSQPIEDGLDYQTKSFAANVVDMQYVASAMWNSLLASKRRQITDRVLYDPSRVREKDINSTNPSAKIPVRATAYGRPIQEAVYAFPYRDDQSASFMQGTTAIINFANTVNGQNPAQQGQFVKGNKTKHEYDDVMGHGDNNLQTMAMSIETTTFTPLKEIIKLNILQYQPEDVIYNPIQKQSVNIQPQDLRKEAIHFKVSDGEIPADKMTGDDMMQTVIQTLGQSQQLAAGYNLAPMFSYMMETQGLDLTPFQKSPAQQQYEQALGAWQQAAALAAKSGAEFSTPQPQPSPAYQQELQQKQQQGGAAPNVTSASLEGTQG
jgi:hypothetical protein